MAKTPAQLRADADKLEKEVKRKAELAKAKAEVARLSKAPARKAK